MDICKTTRPDYLMLEGERGVECHLYTDGVQILVEPATSTEKANL